uniref:Uncharacterized protein n=1 Tax=Saimiri boliviensis boliviensis TaxID=39432 RepID=A0A2K6UPY8_SAIBB
PRKPSGSEPPAEECRMTPQHAGCEASEMPGILIQSALTKHLLRAVLSPERGPYLDPKRGFLELVQERI